MMKLLTLALFASRDRGDVEEAAVVIAESGLPLWLCFCEYSMSTRVLLDVVRNSFDIVRRLRLSPSFLSSSEVLSKIVST